MPREGRARRFRLAVGGSVEPSIDRESEPVCCAIKDRETKDTHNPAPHLGEIKYAQSDENRKFVALMLEWPHSASACPSCPNGVLTQGNGINNAGVIVGTYEDSSGNSYGFIATPQSSAVPEPPAIALAGIGAALWLGYASWWRRRKEGSSTI